MGRCRLTIAFVIGLMLVTACGPALPPSGRPADGADQSLAAAPVVQASRATKLLAAGAAAPDFELPSANGVTFHLADQLQPGQLLAVVFYPGRYCPSCLDLQQVLDDNQAVLADYGARLVAVAGQSWSAVTASDTANNNRLVILADQDGAVARQYGAPRLMPGKPKHPTSPITVFIVDSSGQIACSGPAVTEGTMRLEEWLNCTPPSDSLQP